MYGSHESIQASSQRERREAGRPYIAGTPPVELAAWEIAAYLEQPWEHKEHVTDESS